MADDMNRANGSDDSSATNRLNATPAGSAPLAETPNTGTSDEAMGGSTPSDPNDEVPVPIAMWPSEVDERAQVVEALRGNGPPPRTDTQVDPA